MLRHRALVDTARAGGDGTPAGRSGTFRGTMTPRDLEGVVMTRRSRCHILAATCATRAILRSGVRAALDDMRESFLAGGGGPHRTRV